MDELASIISGTVNREIKFGAGVIEMVMSNIPVCAFLNASDCLALTCMHLQLTVDDLEEILPTSTGNLKHTKGMELLISFSRFSRKEVGYVKIKVMLKQETMSLDDVSWLLCAF